jgi:hypothetical protein
MTAEQQIKLERAAEFIESADRLLDALASSDPELCRAIEAIPGAEHIAKATADQLLGILETAHV